MKHFALVAKLLRSAASTSTRVSGGGVVREKMGYRCIPRVLTKVVAGLVLLASIGRADIGNLGTLSYDELVSGAVNGVTVINFTFNFALPPTFPVLSNVVFMDAQVILTDDTGTAHAPVLLGDLGPGVAQPASLEFLSTQAFESVEFIATLNTTKFNLDGGLVFSADTDAIDTILLPSVGTTLVAGLDSAPITVTGSTSLSPIPEPAGWLLLVTVAASLAGHIRRHRHNSLKDSH
jgi:hypothetical protein